MLNQPHQSLDDDLDCAVMPVLPLPSVWSYLL